MAILITNGATNLSTASGFYRVEDSNMGMGHGTILTLSTTGSSAQTKALTFANVGNCLGTVLGLYYSSNTCTDRSVVARLQETHTPVTISIASPGVVTDTGHGLAADQGIVFATTGALPTGITAGTKYYVIAAGLTADTFRFSTSRGGSAVNTSGSQSGTQAIWIDRAEKTLTPENITNTAGETGTNGKMYGNWITPFTWDTNGVGGALVGGYTITTAANKWRLNILMSGGTSGTWYLRTSNGTVPFHATWCNNALSFNNNDTVVAKDVLTIDQTATIKGTLGTGETAYGSALIVCRSNTPTPGSVSNVVWANPPAASYTLTIDGIVVLGSHSGFQVGYEQSTTATVSIAAPGVITKTAHGLAANQLVKFTTTGALPTGITAGASYFVKTVLDVDTFTISATQGGTAIDTSGSQSGVHTLYWGRIPLVQQAILSFINPTVGTTTGIMSADYVSSSSTISRRSSLFLYGQVPAVRKTTLNGTVAIGASSFVTDDTTNWVNGDQIWIGGQNTQGLGSTTLHSVTSSSGTTVNISPVTAGNTRIDGHPVVLLNNHGIQVNGNTTTRPNFRIVAASNFIISGVGFSEVNSIVNGGGTLGVYPNDIAANRTAHLVEDVSGHSTTTGVALFGTNCQVPVDGATFQRIYTARFSPVYNSWYYQLTSTNKSGTLLIDNCIAMNNSYPMGFSTSTAGVTSFTYTNNIMENSQTYGHYFQGMNSVINNNKIWGCSNASGAFQIWGLVASTGTGNTIDNCAVGKYIGAYTTKNVVFTDDLFGQEVANTVNFDYAPGALIDYEEHSPTGTVNPATTYIGELTTGSQLKITENNNATNADQVYVPNGIITRCGDSLADTTVHTAGTGKFAIRFGPYSSTTPMTWGQTIPTGNIQNKSMTVAVWVKINNATYYAGTKQLPRLTINYDNGTTAYAQAAESTDWQLLFVTFTPTTAYGQITATLSAATDAVNGNSYVYWDDYTVLYPSGYQLDLGGMDLFAAGLPVTPTISTNLSAKDVWTASATEDYGAGTMGEKLSKKLLTFAKWIGLK